MFSVARRSVFALLLAVSQRDLVQKGIVLAVVIVPFIAAGVAIWHVWERYVTWRDIALLVGMYVPISLGVTAGFHRMLTHRSFKAHPIVRFAILLTAPRT